MIRQNTRESAIRREEFHAELKAWLDDTFEVTVGDPDAYGGRAWLWVRHGGEKYYLTADSTREGVRRYMRLVDEHGGDPGWSVVKSARGARYRVAVGPDEQLIPGFHFYVQLDRR